MGFRSTHEFMHGMKLCHNKRTTREQTSNQSLPDSANVTSKQTERLHVWCPVQAWTGVQKRNLIPSRLCLTDPSVLSYHVIGQEAHAGVVPRQRQPPASPLGHHAMGHMPPVPWYGHWGGLPLRWHNTCMCLFTHDMVAEFEVFVTCCDCFLANYLTCRA